MVLTPLHTRMLTLRLSRAESGGVFADARIFDLRKRGIVPLAGKLQGPGVIHDMSVQLRVAGPDLRIQNIQAAMSAFPFAPGPATRGEGCPDRLPDVQRLVGVSLRAHAEYGGRLMEQVGGPRGCFHVFTLLRLLGPTVEAAVDRERARPRDDGATASERAVGSPIFSRSVIVDGMKGEGLAIVLRGTLFDLHFRPGADTLPLEEEMEASCEATTDVEVAVPTMAITASTGRVRYSGANVETVGAWQTVPTVGELVGRTMQKGYTAQVQEVFRGSADLEALQHLLFMLAPALIQCFPSLMEELELRPRRAEGPHAAVDSCHMWRADGPLVRGTASESAKVKNQRAAEAG